KPDCTLTTMLKSQAHCYGSKSTNSSVVAALTACEANATPLPPTASDGNVTQTPTTASEANATPPLTTASDADISTWMKNHHLQLNLAKTELMVFPAKQVIHHNIKINTDSLSLV